MLTPNVNLENKIVLVTGACGFIGANLATKLLNTYNSIKIVGIDSVNDYYDVSIKEYRLNEITKLSESKKNSEFVFVKGNIADKELMTSLFEKYSFCVVVNLAAQAGVRYSITNPDVYIE